MKFIESITSYIIYLNYRLKDNSIDSIIWIVNLVPSRAGFSILKDKISAPFWILHFSLLVYVYGAGSVMYQLRVASSTRDFLKSYVNITLIILIVNNSYWFIKERPLLRTVLNQVIRNDILSMETELLQDKHEKLLSVIKKIILIFYGFNLFDAFFIYIPHRSDVNNDHYSMTSCVGLEPLTATPNRQICRLILGLQEVTIMTAVLNYQTLLLFLIAHTEAMYRLLSEEMLNFNQYASTPESNIFVKNRLPLLVSRHSLTLDIIKNLKALYSMPMGVNFGSNAVCICLFFYLPLREWITFSPVLIYCFLVFFLYCYLCQRLINASEVFENAVYSCGWEKFNLNEQKTIYVMLLQAQKPVTLLAADIIPVNISTFATTIQAMFKFVTVVKL
ncbi:olfactory receptor 54 [Danaus plexippus plexippus]|uniref:Odorant receptor n=1 Tax=Danaus plexippus plexippus TaxID=278856 RepID=A0A212F4V0_DANPL|nr:olfactory receptor 54 [Danaus plexippus plexippus]